MRIEKEPILIIKQYKKDGVIISLPSFLLWGSKT